MIDSTTNLLTTPAKAELYRTALEMLNRSGVPYMVGGTYAFQYYAGISRSTKDFDIFVRPRDLQRMLDVLQRAGFKTEVAFTHWLAKAHHGDKFIDVIYSSGNGVAEVDDEWFAHAVDEEVLGVPVKLCAGRGDDLVEGVHHGARALRRRRRRAPVAPLQRAAELGSAPAGASVRTGASCSAISCSSDSSTRASARSSRRRS